MSAAPDGGAGETGAAMLREDRYGSVAVLTLDNPARRNALGLPMRRAGLALAALVACHFALLRSNAEPFAAAGAVVNRVMDQTAPVEDALRHGAIV